jgi:hypothetical protein
MEVLMAKSITHRGPLDLAKYQPASAEFVHLSVRDLLEARDLYHAHLVRHPNVVATAIGRYRIRKGDSWPNSQAKRHGVGVRMLQNSEIRPYSWPCLLVFVSRWEDPKDFAARPGEMVPKTLFMPDGKRIPVCVIEAPRASMTAIEAPRVQFPVNNIGPGHPVIARVQGREYLATIGCLVSDGHKIYALTNRHVTGEPGEDIFSRLAGSDERIGASATKQLTRLPFTALYPTFPGRDTYVNLDIGLIDIDRLDRWTTRVRDIGVPGPMADFSGDYISLSLIGCQVRGRGAAGGDMKGEVHGLFYRYKTLGGFEYVADLLIGPRAAGEHATAKADVSPFVTLPGDSGTMWMLEPEPLRGRSEGQELAPLAIQWGRNMLASAEAAEPQAYALATLMSRVCALLEVDPLRAWNVDQTDTWGAMGHFAIAARARVALSDRFAKLVALIDSNSEIISHSEAVLEQGEFSGMGEADFVPLADVPDFYWKPRIAKQGHARTMEGPNHFADMDQQNANGKTLLDLTMDDEFLDPDKWNAFYESVRDLLSGKAIELRHRGLLPFRVWQIFDAMVGFAAKGDDARFVCAAGVLTHYIGDACQPLHISYLHDGDPLRPVKHVFSKGKREGETELRPLGNGVHAAYEDDMVFGNRKAILDALKKTPKVDASELVDNGFAAAKATISMMRTTFKLMPPADIVQAYVNVGKGGKAASAALWNEFGTRTKTSMQNGAHLLGLLWESAWRAGGGESNVSSTKALTEAQAMKIVADANFLPSMTIDVIGSILKRDVANAPAAAPSKKKPRRRPR